MDINHRRGGSPSKIFLNTLLIYISFIKNTIYIIISILLFKKSFFPNLIINIKI